MDTSNGIEPIRVSEGLNRLNSLLTKDSRATAWIPFAAVVLLIPLAIWAFWEAYESEVDRTIEQHAKQLNFVARMSILSRDSVIGNKVMDDLVGPSLLSSVKVTDTEGQVWYDRSKIGEGVYDFTRRAKLPLYENTVSFGHTDELLNPDNVSVQAPKLIGYLELEINTSSLFLGFLIRSLLTAIIALVTLLISVSVHRRHSRKVTRLSTQVFNAVTQFTSKNYDHRIRKHSGSEEEEIVACVVNRLGETLKYQVSSLETGKARLIELREEADRQRRLTVDMAGTLIGDISRDLTSATRNLETLSEQLGNKHPILKKFIPTVSEPIGTAMETCRAASVIRQSTFFPVENSAEKIRILVISEDSGELTNALLEFQNVDAHWVNAKASVLLMTKKYAYDAILVDLCAGPKSFLLGRELRERSLLNEKGRPSMILAYSYGRNAELEERVTSAGFDDLINKPYGIYSIRNRLDNGITLPIKS